MPDAWRISLWRLHNEDRCMKPDPPMRPAGTAAGATPVRRFLLPHVTETRGPPPDDVESRQSARERLENVLRRRSERLRER